MPMLERLQGDLKVAMMKRDVLTRDTLRMSMAALKNRRIELGEDLDEAEDLVVLTKEVKKRQDAAELYDQAGREDLASKERAEIEVVQRYLPHMFSEEKTRELVQGAIDALGVSSRKDLGQIMKAIMAEHRGKVDGKLVQRLAGEVLG